MTGGLAWLALANAGLTAFGASLYMGLMLVVRFFLRPAWKSLTVDTVEVFFGIPIVAATRFFRFMFIPYLLSSALLVWTGWGHAAAVVCAIVAAACYLTLALWFQLRMLPVNTRLLSGDVTDNGELQPLFARWNALNEVRVVVSCIYWLAALGFLVSAHHIWEGLS